MGIETAIGLLSLVGGIATGVMQASAASDAADERREAARIQSNRESIRNQENRRAMVREERIKRAQILQSSETTGTGGSSGEAGATGSLGTQTGLSLSFNTGDTRAVQDINAANQRAADANERARQIGFAGDLFQTSLRGFNRIF